MTSPTYLIRLTRVLVLGAIVAGTVASGANAIPLVDVNNAASTQANVPTPLGLRADGLRWQGIAQTYKQSQAVASLPTARGLRADGLRWQGIAQTYEQSQGQAQARLVSVSQSSGFNWRDYGIGIGSGMGLILVLAGGLAIGRQRRHSVQTA